MPLPFERRRCVSGDNCCRSPPDFIDDFIEDIEKLAVAQSRRAQTVYPSPQDGYPPAAHFHRKHVEQRSTRTRQRGAEPIGAAALDPKHGKHDIELLVVHEILKSSLRLGNMAPAAFLFQTSLRQGKRLAAIAHKKDLDTASIV